MASVASVASRVTLRSLLLDARARFAAQAAITAGTCTWSYNHLFQRADVLAARLRLAGVGPKVLVAVNLPRGPHALVAILAVLLAGGGYVALDPSYPRARLRLMADDADPLVALGDDETAAIVGEDVPVVRVGDLDIGDGPPMADRAGDQPPMDTAPAQPGRGHRNGNGHGNGEGDGAEPVPDDTCYVFYTSGSTGRPKGIEASHANVVGFLDGMDGVLGATPSRWLGLTSTSFDPSVVELLWTVTRGHHIVFPPSGSTVGLVSDGTIASVIEDHAVTHVQCTPTVLQLLLQDPRHRRSLEQVRHVLVGGEALPPALAREARAAVGGRVTNVYGPTETTVWAFAHDVTADDAGTAATRVPIGRPLAGVTAKVLADGRDVSGSGEPGELVLGGPGVAKGYLGQPTLTAERFFSDGSGAPRQYATGDLVRVARGGVFEFLGRVDDQVKINGTRVELGDVEAAVATHAAVARAVAFVLGEGLDAQLGVAVQPRAEWPDPEDVRRHAAELLPAAVVPSRVVVVPTFPLTPSGKADRRALGRIAPATRLPDTVTVRRLFAETLGRDEIGVGDDFFEFGGDSLAAVHLLARVQDEYAIVLGLSVLVEAPTPARLTARLAERCFEAPDTATSPVLVALTERAPGVPFFCVHGIGGNVLNLVPLARALREPRSFFGIQAAGVDGRSAHDVSVEAMAERYVRAVRSVQPFGPYALGGYSDGGIIALEMARRLETDGERVATVVLFDAELAAPGGKTRARRWHNLRTNAATHGLPAVLAAAGRAISRRVAPSQRATERTLGYKALRPRQLVDLSQVLQPVLRRHPPAVYTCPVLQVRAARFRPCDEPESSWDPLLQGPIERVAVPGDHLTMFSPPHVDRLADRLAAHLSNLDEPGPGVRTVTA